MKCTFGTSCAFLPAKNFMVSSFFGGLKVPPICEKTTCRAEISISWGKGLIFRNDNGVYSIAWVIGDLLRIVVGRTEKVVYSHELYNL